MNELTIILISYIAISQIIVVILMMSEINKYIKWALATICFPFGVLMALGFIWVSEIKKKKEDW